jgi:hypothetical protein
MPEKGITAFFIILTLILNVRKTHGKCVISHSGKAYFIDKIQLNYPVTQNNYSIYSKKEISNLFIFHILDDSREKSFLYY